MKRGIQVFRKFCAWLESRRTDPVEERLRALFDFMLRDHGFQFARNELGDVRDPNTGKRVFYGPYNAYSIYNQSICINILHLVQRDDYEIFITDAYRADQRYIHSGRREDSRFAYHLDLYAAQIRETIEGSGELYGAVIS